MPNAVLNERGAHIVDPCHIATLDVLGPTIQFLTPPEDDNAPCIMRGMIPPGVFVPLHSHAAPETFLHISGGLEGLTQTAEGFQWVRIKPGDTFHVPGGAKHAFRNQSRQPTVSIVVSTSKMGRFFREIGTPVITGGHLSAPPSGEVFQHFMETAERYGYWNATPEENEQVGLYLLPDW
jgi:quercetin dioxygenase-like cupin family protein